MNNISVIIYREKYSKIKWTVQMISKFQIIERKFRHELSVLLGYSKLVKKYFPEHKIRKVKFVSA